MQRRLLSFTAVGRPAAPMMPARFLSSSSTSSTLSCNASASAIPFVPLTSSSLSRRTSLIASSEAFSQRLAMVPLDRTIEIVPTNHTVLDVILPSLPLPLPLDMPLSPEGINAPMEALKRTYQPSTVKRHHRHGFLVRMMNKNGRRTIARKKAKGRHKLGV